MCQQFCSQNSIFISKGGEDVSVNSSSHCRPLLWLPHCSWWSSDSPFEGETEGYSVKQGRYYPLSMALLNQTHLKISLNLLIYSFAPTSTVCQEWSSIRPETETTMCLLVPLPLEIPFSGDLPKSRLWVGFSQFFHSVSLYFLYTTQFCSCSSWFSSWPFWMVKDEAIFIYFFAKKSWLEPAWVL